MYKNLEDAPIDILSEWAYESYKDFYGVKGHHMKGWSKRDYVDWIKDHFEWDSDMQGWRNSVPFIEDD